MLLTKSIATADSVRPALTAAAPWGHDVAFSEAQLVSVHNCVLAGRSVCVCVCVCLACVCLVCVCVYCNCVLADGLGSLLYRARSLCVPVPQAALHFYFLFSICYNCVLADGLGSLLHRHSFIFCNIKNKKMESSQTDLATCSTAILFFL
jgi:hypothetical protein